MHKSFISTAVLLMGMTISYSNAGADTWTAVASANSAPASPTPQNQRKVTVPAGTRILIRTIYPIDSSKQTTGYRFTASL